MQRIIHHVAAEITTNPISFISTYEKKEKQQQQEKQNNDKNKKEENKPKPQQSNISKNDAEQKLNALEQREKELQDKMHKAGSANSAVQDKDW